MSQRPSFPARLTPSGKPENSRGRLTISSPGTDPGSRGQAAPARFGMVGSRQPMTPVNTQAFPATTGMGLDSSAVRAHMVNKLAQQGIQDTWVLKAMARIERHRFVESALANQAYEDTSLPIGLGQTISKPNVVARMIELLRQGADGRLGRVLEIGTGCGYQAAVLSHVATEVYSIERLRGLHEKAKTHLLPFRLPNVHLILGDGMLGFPKGAPYAGIISAAGGDDVPAAWLAQLAVGGRLVAPTVTSSGQQALVVIQKTAQGFDRQILEAVHFVPLKSGIA